MRLHLIAIGRRMPDWVASGFAEYRDRLPREWGFQLHALATPAGSKSMDATTRLRREGEALLKAVPEGARIITLDERGRKVDTRGLAQRLAGWQDDGRDVALLIGGADGLDTTVRERAEWAWSLSPLTFPHMLVRVLVAEQLYRAWSLLNNHPYHRA
ncbi:MULTISPECIES: 23S rRNA (pseudouridine(1915)-N(3))-methyltransferase RlmH [unclassified Thioalkalivibrio]|uniref:23S rRNA (pseudouridine(1915)-N(3))-methyltransferase RlmH n=1 Tax=unclassified Thioalkalivibrio TaxID=2621013 RepID=UPI000377C0FD|nr:MULTISPECIES: 23S rRNA (pseudouridine(1915)-N(3))-methyltransferase RlmH [unclassified Thioalkalivibrio]